MSWAANGQLLLVIYSLREGEAPRRQSPQHSSCWGGRRELTLCLPLSLSLSPGQLLGREAALWLALQVALHCLQVARRVSGRRTEISEEVAPLRRMTPPPCDPAPPGLSVSLSSRRLFTPCSVAAAPGKQKKSWNLEGGAGEEGSQDEILPLPARVSAGRVPLHPSLSETLALGGVPPRPRAWSPNKGQVSQSPLRRDISLVVRSLHETCVACAQVLAELGGAASLPLSPGFASSGRSRAWAAERRGPKRILRRQLRSAGHAKAGLRLVAGPRGDRNRPPVPQMHWVEPHEVTFFF